MLAGLFQRGLGIGDELPGGLFVFCFAEGIEKAGNVKQASQSGENLQVGAGISAQDEEEQISQPACSSEGDPLGGATKCDKGFAECIG